MKKPTKPPIDKAMTAEAIIAMRKENEALKTSNIALANALRVIRNSMSKMSGGITSLLGE